MKKTNDHKCPLCGRVCEDNDMLQVHMNEYHREKPKFVPVKPQFEPVEVKKKATVKCPHCFVRIAEEELEAHIAKEHYM